MLIISKLTTFPNSVLPLLFPNYQAFFPKSLTCLCFRYPKRFPCFSVEKSAMSSSSSSKVVTEYAKSSRSSCKKCSKKIDAKALRLGLESRDVRGFDSCKWFHIECFPFASAQIGSVTAIKGFSSLQGSDQEAIKELVVGTVQSKLNRRASDEDGENDVEDRDLKKAKLSVSHQQPNLDIVLSVSDIKEKYKDAKLLPKWKAFHTIIFLERDDGLHDSSKIAAFDFDGCLAKTSVNRVGSDAWSLMFLSIPNKLQSLYNDGYKLVIFTNEANIERWKNKRQTAVDSKLGRLNNFIERVKVPIQVFVACGNRKPEGGVEDPYRKPGSGMWRIMEQHFNSGISIQPNQRFGCATA